MPTFIPKAVHFPAAGKNEILVSGEVDGEVRNAPIITDEGLADEYRAADATRDASIKTQHEVIEAANVAIGKVVKKHAEVRAEIDKRVMPLAVEAFDALHKVVNPESEPAE